MRSRRRWLYPLGALGLALGSPAGLLLVRWLSSGSSAGTAIARELRADPSTYLYLWISTAIVFGLFGWIVGRLQDRLEATSLTDPLTVLPNRRFLLARMADELARAGRHGTALSLLLVDVDQLKFLNDRHAHETGDAALCAVAESLRRACRRTDVAARYGGDEFVVLAPMTVADEALGLAQRIQAHLSEIVVALGLPPVSVSIGVADVERAGSSRAEALVATADRALHEAKAGGRNRTAVATRAGSGRFRRAHASLPPPARASRPPFRSREGVTKEKSHD